MPLDRELSASYFFSNAITFPSDVNLVIFSGNKQLVTIKADGTIEYGADYTPDIAAKAFWDAVGLERKNRNL